LLEHTANAQSCPRARRLSERWEWEDSSSWRQWLDFLIYWNKSTWAGFHDIIQGH